MYSISIHSVVVVKAEDHHTDRNILEDSYYTANIFMVIFTVFKCVRLSTVVSLYGLHLIAAPSTAE